MTTTALTESSLLHQWDVLSDGNPVQEVAHITNGSHPGNCISVLRVSINVILFLFQAQLEGVLI